MLFCIFCYDSAPMALLGCGIVLTHLAHSKHNIQMSVHGQTQQHADHGGVLPLLLESIQVRSMASLGSWGFVWVAFLNPGPFQDFLGESQLGHGHSVGGGVLVEFNPEVCREVPFVGQLEPWSLQPFD